MPCTLETNFCSQTEREKDHVSEGHRSRHTNAIRRLRCKPFDAYATSGKLANYTLPTRCIYPHYNRLALPSMNSKLKRHRTNCRRTVSEGVDCNLDSMH